MTFAQDYTGVLKYTAVAPVIDGKLDGIWMGANTYPISQALQSETPTLGDAGTTYWKGLWSDNGIYIYVKCNDDEWYPAYMNNATDNWMYDKVEIYFDVNAVLKDGLGGKNSGDGHIQIAPGTSEDLISGTMVEDGDGQHAFYVTAPTWAAEYFVPFSRLKDKDGNQVATTATIGFDVTAIDGESAAPGVRQRAVWSNPGTGPAASESWANMDDCGTITLSEEVAVGGAIIAKTETAPKIDGEIDAVWDNAMPNNIAVPFRTEVATVGDLGETYWKMLWNADGMYILIAVADDNWLPYWAPGGGANGYEYDKIELYFDTNVPRQDGVGGQAATPGTLQIAPDSKDGILDGTMQSGTSMGIEYNWAIKVTDPTFVCEYFVPWDIVNDKDGVGFDKVSGVMGFDVTVIDRDPGDAARKRVNWANAGAKDENWANMDDAGVIMMDGVTEVIPVDKVTVKTGGTITTDNGTLQMEATVEPSDASAQKVKWTVENGTGRATISATGLLTGVVNGTVTVTATATDGYFASGKTTVTISGQVVTKREISYVTNGFFDQGDSKAPWGGGVVADGVLVCSPTPNADPTARNYWDWTTTQVVAVAQEDKNEPFTLSFKMWSDSPSTSSTDEVDVDFEDSNNSYSRYGTSTHPYATQGGTSDWNWLITSEPTMYTFDVIFANMAENCHQSLQFMLGRNAGPIYIDSVILVKNADLTLVSAKTLANASNKVKLYPNPVQNELTISRISVANSNVSVYNAVGQKLMEKIANGTVAKFDVSDLRKGMYFVRFTDGTSEKFIKQ